MHESAETAPLRERLRQAEWAWGWHPEGALDEDGSAVRAGYGHHMSQMLHRLPRDGQTDDMKASIQQMLADLAALVHAPACDSEPVRSALTANVRLLLDKYAGRSKWVGYERARREAWDEIERDLRWLLSTSPGKE